MAGARYSIADYALAILNLLPRGRIWPKGDDSVQYQVASGLAPSLNRLDGAANDLLVDAFPPTAVNLLPEWEASLGLPDPCLGPNPTISARQAAVQSRFLAGGGAGQSTTFFIAFAATLGFSITIQEYTGSTTLANTWQVTVANSGTTYATTESTTEDYIDVVTMGADVLQCEFARLKPAHTILNWNLV